jgi:hypothetical protein
MSNSYSENQDYVFTDRCAHSFTKIQEPFKNFVCLKGFKSHAEDQQLLITVIINLVAWEALMPGFVHH